MLVILANHLAQDTLAVLQDVFHGTLSKEFVKSIFSNFGKITENIDLLNR